MKSAKELLEFSLDDQIFVRNIPSKKVDEKIIRKLNEIKSKHERAGIIKESNIKNAYYNFIIINQKDSSNLFEYFNSKKLSRDLSRALTYFEKTSPYDVKIVDSPFLSKALDIFDRYFIPNIMNGIFDALLQSWTSENAQLMRNFLIRHIDQYNGKIRLLKTLKKFKNYFCEDNGPTQLALKFIREQIPLSKVWEYLELPNYTHVFNYFGSVCIAYVNLVKQTNFNKEILVSIFDFLKIHKSIETIKEVVSNIVEHIGNNASEDLREPIQSYILENLGDPRITGNLSNWQGISEKARIIFTQWITREDLTFFFDVVAKACNDDKFEYRKKFWLSYLEYIVFCCPVLRKDAFIYFASNPMTKEYFNKRNQATLYGGNKNQHAFIIQMGDLIFVEFSTQGACYIYEKSKLPFNINSQHFRIDRDFQNYDSGNFLRDKEKAFERIIHYNSEYYSWQNKLSRLIKDKLGIEPSRSYKIK